ncbi:MAG: hypothetical protein LBE74_08850, partial [Treponema sp.]|nr:hypothetical protein [Treponema sp.]
MRLPKRFTTGILGAALVFGFLSCDTGNGGGGTISEPTVDKSALTAGVAAAENAKAGVAVGAQADIAAGLPYVSQAAMDALESAIAAAQARRNDAAATQAEVNTAVQTLASAVAAFT